MNSFKLKFKINIIYFTMKHITFICLSLFLINCNMVFSQTSDSKKEIEQVLETWHKAAREANFNGYFQLMTEDAVFIGTDAKENWNRVAFESFAKPYFDKGKAWSFTTLERHVYLDETRNLAWFDELLATQMKICRGSGVLVKIAGEWKIKHYVLSMTIPNDNSTEVIKIKSPIEDKMIQQLSKK